MKNESYYNRSEHNKKNPYTCVSNKLINDSRLSSIEKFIMIWLLSKTDNYIINMIQVQKDIGMSRNLFHKTIQHLIRLGYINKIKIQGGIKWGINEIPLIRDSTIRDSSIIESSIIESSIIENDTLRSNNKKLSNNKRESNNKKLSNNKREREAQIEATGKFDNYTKEQIGNEIDIFLKIKFKYWKNVLYGSDPIKIIEKVQDSFSPNDIKKLTEMLWLYKKM